MRILTTILLSFATLLADNPHALPRPPLRRRLRTERDRRQRAIRLSPFMFANTPGKMAQWFTPTIAQRRGPRARAPVAGQRTRPNPRPLAPLNKAHPAGERRSRVSLPAQAGILGDPICQPWFDFPVSMHRHCQNLDFA